MSEHFLFNHDEWDGPAAFYVGHRTAKNMVGAAGEYMACADLTMRGIPAFLADAGAPYDLACDINGKLLRVQVKTSSKAYRNGKKHQFQFELRRGYGKSKLPREERIYDVEAFALVCAPLRAVRYFFEAEKNRVFYRPEDFSPNECDRTFEELLKLAQ